jgi:hypothetical protein
MIEIKCEMTNCKKNNQHQGAHITTRIGVMCAVCYENNYEERYYGAVQWMTTTARRLEQIRTEYHKGILEIIEKNGKTIQEFHHDVDIATDEFEESYQKWCKENTKED